MGVGKNNGRLMEVGVAKDFLSKDFKFVTEGLVSQPPDNGYPMQAYIVGYVTNIDNIQSLSGYNPYNSDFFASARKSRHKIGFSQFASAKWYFAPAKKTNKIKTKNKTKQKQKTKQNKTKKNADAKQAFLNCRQQNGNLRR